MVLSVVRFKKLSRLGLVWFIKVLCWCFFWFSVVRKIKLMLVVVRCLYLDLLLGWLGLIRVFVGGKCLFIK